VKGQQQYCLAPDPDNPKLVCICYAHDGSHIYSRPRPYLRRFVSSQPRKVQRRGRPTLSCALCQTEQNALYCKVAQHYKIFGYRRTAALIGKRDGFCDSCYRELHRLTAFEAECRISKPTTVAR